MKCIKRQINVRGVGFMRCPGLINRCGGIAKAPGNAVVPWYMHDIATDAEFMDIALSGSRFTTLCTTIIEIKISMHRPCELCVTPVQAILAPCSCVRNNFRDPQNATKSAGFRRIKEIIASDLCPFGIADTVVFGGVGVKVGFDEIIAAFDTDLRGVSNATESVKEQRSIRISRDPLCFHRSSPQAPSTCRVETRWMCSRGTRRVEGRQRHSSRTLP